MQTHSALRRLLVLLWLVVAFGCGGPKRNNPADPDVGTQAEGIQLVSALPDDVGAGSLLLADIRFTVTAADLREPISGQMNLVGDRATGVAQGVPDGLARVFRVDGFDENRIRTYSVADTVDIAQGAPQSPLRLPLHRLTGAVEVTSSLPPEIEGLTVLIVTGRDTMAHDFEIKDANFQQNIGDIPTGSGVQLLLRGRDADGQTLVSETLRTDIRESLLARVRLPGVTGAVAILANFPDYVPVVEVDRFSDAAGGFYRRSENPGLPAPNEAIDFDERFLHQALGPNQESIQFYNFDVHSKTPARMYQLIDRRGDPIVGQLPIFAEIPGDPGYNDLRQVVAVRITDGDFQPNSITSLSDLQAIAEDTTETDLIRNCVMVPDGSTASFRFDVTDAVGLHDGWYGDRVVRYLLFENPDSQAIAEFSGGEISAPVMYAFLENDRDTADGFALDAGGTTHNVATRLPKQEGYSPLWALRVFRLSVFDRVTSVTSAQDNDREDNILSTEDVLIINAPVVTVGARGGG
ncbi:MAG: hypothetical protein VX733_07400 [Candidatus Latescibacterota bacterium]|nr:hypothetical protein [Candidatus Latescibacterota bacterium]